MDFYTKIVQYKWLCKHFITIHKSKPVSLGLKALLKLYISSKSREWFQSSVVLTSHYGHMSAAGKEELGLVSLLGKPLAYLPKPLKGLDICLPVLDFIRAILVIASPLWVLLSLSLWVKGFGHTEWRTLLEDAFLGKRESTGKDLRTETGILITWNGSISLIITRGEKVVWTRDVADILKRLRKQLGICINIRMFFLYTSNVLKTVSFPYFVNHPCLQQCNILAYRSTAAKLITGLC